MNLSRRAMLARGGITGVGLAAGSWSSLARADNPSQRVRVGVIGTGVRGKYLIGNLPEAARVEAICDCAASRIAGTLQPQGEFKEVLERFRTQRASQCATFQDYRRMIDAGNLDAVIIATPDHHHVQAALLALQAGLDVYLEKPMTLTISEGRVLADAVKKTGRVLQVGSQQRSMEVNRFACEFVRDGGLGKIRRIEFPNLPGPMATPNFAKQKIPEGLAWDLFLGPTATRPHNRKLWVKDEFKVGDLLWRGWDLFEDFSGHMMTNWGGHSVDMVQYALGMDDSGPTKVRPLHEVGPEQLERDWKETWHTKTPAAKDSWASDSRFSAVRVEYPGEITMDLLPGVKDAVFYGELGQMRIGRNRFECTPADLISEQPDAEAAAIWSGRGHVARPHLANWLDAIREGSQLNAPVEVGHRSVTVCHLVNLARRLNRALRWDPGSEQFLDDPAANQWLDRERREPFVLPTI